MQNNTQVVTISQEAYYYVNQSKINAVVNQRMKSLFENFIIFKQTTWNDKKLKFFCECCKDRLMMKDEVLFEDQSKAEYLYFLLSGTLRVEKEVVEVTENFWPVKVHSWKTE